MLKIDEHCTSHTILSMTDTFLLHLRNLRTRTVEQENAEFMRTLDARRQSFLGSIDYDAIRKDFVNQVAAHPEHCRYSHMLTMSLEDIVVDRHTMVGSVWTENPYLVCTFWANNRVIRHPCLKRDMDAAFSDYISSEMTPIRTALDREFPDAVVHTSVFIHSNAQCYVRFEIQYDVPALNTEMSLPH